MAIDVSPSFVVNFYLIATLKTPQVLHEGPSISFALLSFRMESAQGHLDKILPCEDCTIYAASLKLDHFTKKFVQLLQSCFWGTPRQKAF